jgi:sucrose-phosphate synthase
MGTAHPTDAIGRRLMSLGNFIITDIDNTLIGDDNSRLNELIELLVRYREKIGFGVATGRNIDSARKILAKYQIPKPDVMIPSVGAEIYYGSDLHYGQGWDTHLKHRWNREKIKELLKDLDFLTYQEEETQRKYKISYYMSPIKDGLAIIHHRLLKHKCRYNLIYSHGQYLDILPYRASKGKAIRYISYQWEIPLKNFLVCGDSGNDEEMLRGEPKAVVVANFSKELKSLRDNRNVYFAKLPSAGGIIEGLQHYNFIERS